MLEERLPKKVQFLFKKIYYSFLYVSVSMEAGFFYCSAVKRNYTIEAVIWNAQCGTYHPQVTPLNVKGLVSCDGIQFISRLSYVPRTFWHLPGYLLMKRFFCKSERKSAAFLSWMHKGLLHRTNFLADVFLNFLIF